MTVSIKGFRASPVNLAVSMKGLRASPVNLVVSMKGLMASSDSVHELIKGLGAMPLNVAVLGKRAWLTVTSSDIGSQSPRAIA